MATAIYAQLRCNVAEYSRALFEGKRVKTHDPAFKYAVVAEEERNRGSEIDIEKHTASLQIF